MSALSIVLEDYFRTSGDSQTAFAATHKIDRGTVNRAVKGTTMPGTDAARRIITALPLEWQPRAIAAWLQDETPSEFRHLVSVIPLENRVREVPALRQLPDDLSPDIRDDVLWITDMATLHPEIRQLLAAMRRFHSKQG